jgi:hypothetical protein
MSRNTAEGSPLVEIDTPTEAGSEVVPIAQDKLEHLQGLLEQTIETDGLGPAQPLSEAAQSNVAFPDPATLPIRWQPPVPEGAYLASQHQVELWQAQQRGQESVLSLLEVAEYELRALRRAEDQGFVLGPLQLLINENSHEVRRGGHACDFGGQLFKWAIFIELCVRFPHYYPADELRQQAWHRQDAATPSEETFHVHVSGIRTLLRPLGLTVECKRGCGYRLENTPQIQD